jgi:hypothetical protein
MIDPSFDTVVTPYPMTMQELESKYRDLEQALQKKNEDYDFVLARLQKRSAQIDSFEEALRDNSWDFDEDTLNDLASYFGISLEREYSVEITVTFSGTVTVPLDYDIDDLENDLSASIDTHHYGNSSVVVDFSEDNMEINYTEI